MQATNFFWLCGLSFITLTGAVVGRAIGIFDQPSETAAGPQVIAAVRDLPKDVTIDSRYIALRPMSREEQAAYAQNPKAFLPPMMTAAAGRITKVAVKANEPILAATLSDEQPKPLSERITPGMRAVNVSVSIDNSMGGQIRPDDWVDVTLTTNIVDVVTEQEMTRTAVIARGVRVIMKRNTVYPLYRPLDEDKPIAFTLEANPYRAALIAYAAEQGDLILSALPSAEQESLQAERDAVVEAYGEWQENDLLEVERVERIISGAHSVGDEDLMEIFGIPPPQNPGESKPQVVRIEKVVGVQRQSDFVFERTNTHGHQFNATESTDPPVPTPEEAALDSDDPKKCKSCEEARRRRLEEERKSLKGQPFRFSRPDQNSAGSDRQQGNDKEVAAINSENGWEQLVNRSVK